MTPRALLTLVGAIALSGGAAGWLTAPSPAAPALSARAHFEAPQHMGERAGAARERFAALGYGQEPPPAAEPEGPPPPDIAVLFRRDLTAIQETASGRVVVIIDSNADFRRRSIGVGGVYQDGWRVAAISEQSVELRRRRETRSVGFFDEVVDPPQ